MVSFVTPEDRESHGEGRVREGKVNGRSKKSSMRGKRKQGEESSFGRNGHTYAIKRHA